MKQRRLRAALLLAATLYLAAAVALTAMAYRDRPEYADGAVTYVAPYDGPTMAEADIAADQAEVARKELARQQVVGDRIDRYLARRGSPAEGHGVDFVISGEAYGVNPMLLVGIMGKESYFGQQNFAPYNAWGLMQHPDGFSSWPEGIEAATAFLDNYFGDPVVAADCPGYCEGSPSSWFSEIDAIMEEI